MKVSKSSVLVACAVFALSACGGGGGGGSSTTSSTSTTTTTTTSSASVATSLSATIVIAASGSVDLTITISNAGSSAVSGAALSIPLPSGGKSTASYIVGSPCSSTGFTIGSAFSLSGLSVPAGATCTNTITLSPSTAGTFAFTPSGLSSVTAGTTATLTINPGAATTVVGTQMGGARQGVALNIAANSGVVTTFAGTSSFGSGDGTGTSASLFNPKGITTDGNYLYVADSGYNVIRKINLANQQVTTIGATRFSTPFLSLEGITTDGQNLYIVDSGHHSISKMDPATGVVSTLAGSGVAGAADGFGSSASFNFPKGITCDGPNLYVADTSNNSIRKIVISTGEVSTIASTAISGIVISSPKAITTNGTELYFAGMYDTVWKLVLSSGQVTSFASLGAWVTPESFTTDGTYLYVTESLSATVRKIALSTATITTLAGSKCAGGYACGFGLDGTGALAKFNFIEGIVTDGKSLYVADRNGYYGNFIRNIQ